jgi:hypothetical protein
LIKLEISMKDAIVFRDRTVHLRALQQTLTYAGLLEGLPTKEMNARIIEQVLKEAANQIYGVPPYLVPPTEKPIDYKSDGSRYPFGTPAQLPSVLCVARLESFKPTGDSSCYASGLIVIWFQSDFALPIEDEILHHLSLTDWNSHAGSFDY